MTRPVILLAVANHDLQQQVKWLLLCQGVEALEASSNPAILECLQNSKPHLLILEPSQNNGTDTLEIAGHIRRCDRRFPIILVTAHGSEALAVTALRAGVKDYFKQPFSPEEFVAAINRCISDRLSQHTCMKNKPIVSWLADRQQLIGESSFIRRIKAYLLKVAAVDSHVLITGETGTGKELTAQYIHQQSTRHGKPLIAINCAALPDGLLESELFGYEKGAFTGAHTTYAGKLKLADGGTVFFDEIGDMSPYAQAKILRVIESKEVYPLGGKRSIPLDIRIIAATNRDLEHLVAKGKFRQDLYFRLNVAKVHLPPLRERKEDIPHLVDYYLQEFNNRLGGNIEGFTDEALELLLRHDWPGNIRELKNLLEAIFIDPPLDRIAIEDLPESIRQPYQAEERATLTERERLLSALYSVNWNKSKAAEQLHWSRMTLYRKMAKYHIRESKAGQSRGRDPQAKTVTSSDSV